MGYTTEFEGSLQIQPPLNEKEVEYLKKFSDSRRMDRKKGPYFVDGTDFLSDADIINPDQPPKGQPGLWCQWEPTEDGTKIQWNGAEKFYSPVEWMQYLIEHFIGDNPLAKSELPFLNKHVVHGIIEAQGEEVKDHWFLVVENNTVKEMRRYDLNNLPPINNKLLDDILLDNPRVKDLSKRFGANVEQLSNQNVAQALQEQISKVEQTTEVKNIYNKKSNRFKF